MFFASPVAADPIAIANVTRGEAVNFEKEVLPLLQRSCLACHSAGERQGELVLESPATMRKGGDSGPALIPGRGADSLMLKLAAHQDDPAMPPEDNDVNAPAFSSEELGLLRLWIDQGARASGSAGTLSPKAWQSMPSRISPVYAVALTEDGQYVAASRSNQLFLYHVPTGRLVAKLSDGTIIDSDKKPLGVAHQDLVQSLAFNRDGDLLASGSFREVKLWRRPSDVQQRKYDSAEAVNALSVSPDRTLLAASSGNNVQVRTVDEGKLVATLEGHTDVVTGIRFAADGMQIVTASKDGSIRTWDAASGNPRGFIKTPTPLAAIELINTATPTEAQPTPRQLIVTGGEDRIVRTLSLPTSAPRKWEGIAGQLKLTATSRDQRSLAVLTAAGKLHVFQLDAGDWNEIANGELDAANVTSLSLHLTVEAEKPTVGSVFISTSDGSIEVWSISEKNVVASWRGEAAATTALSVGSEGKLLSSGHDMGAASLWNLTVAENETLDGPATGGIETFARSPSGILLASSGSLDGKPTILVRNLDTAKVTHQLVGHAGIARALAFSADNQRLISGGDDQALSIWNLSAGNAAAITKIEGQKIEGQGAVVDAVAFTPDGSQVLASAGNSIRLWNLDDSAMVHEMAGHTDRIRYIGIGEDSIPYSVSDDNTVRFWNVADGKQTRTFNMPAKSTAVAVTFDSQRLAVAGADRQVRVFQLNNGQVMQTLPDAGNQVTALAFSADAKQLVATLSDGKLNREAIIWDMTVTPPRRQESVIDTDLGAVLLDRKPGIALVGTSTGQWRRSSLRFVQRFEGNTKPIRRTIFAPGNRVVVVAAEDGALRGFNVSDGNATFSTSHGAAINGLAVSTDGQVYATAGANNTVRLWRTNGSAFNPSQIAGLPGPATSVAFSADGKKVVVGSGGDAPTIGVYDLATALLQQVFPNHMAGSTGALALPAGDGEPSSIVSFAPDSVWTWEINAIREIPGHGGGITSLAALPSAPRQVISGSLDATARHWNLDTGQSLRTFSHGGPVLAVAVRPDGQRVATASDNKVARLWNINGQQIAQLRGDLRQQTRVVRLTQQERASTARVAVAKQRLDAAIKDTPKKAEAEKKGSETLAKANTDVTAKEEALGKVDKIKIDAEKLAIEASAKARRAQLAKTSAEDGVRQATDDVVQLQKRATQLAAIASASPENAELKTAAADAQAAVVTSQTALQTLQKTVPELTKAAQTAINEANQMTQKATQQQKPYNDALAALTVAKSAQNLAAQQHAIAVRELKTAQEAEPLAKEKHAQMEAALVENKKLLEAAKVESTAAEMPLRAIAFSPDNSILATAGDFGSAHTWDAETGSALAAYAGHEQPLLTTLFLDDQRLLTGSADKSVRAWELNPEWRLEKTIGGVSKPELIAHRVLALDFSQDASQLVVGGGIPSRNGELSVFNVADGKRTFYLPQAHDDVIHAAEFSPDGKRLATAGADRYVRTFDLASAQQLRRLEGHTNYVLGITWKGDGQTLASSAADNTVKIWDAETGDQRRTISNFNKHVTSVHFVGETDTIVSSCGDRSVRMHNSANGGNVRSFGGSDAWVHCVVIVPNSTVVAAGTANGTLQVWNGTNGQVIKKLQVGE